MSIDGDFLEAMLTCPVAEESDEVFHFWLEGLPESVMETIRQSVDNFDVTNIRLLLSNTKPGIF